MNFFGVEGMRCKIAGRVVLESGFPDGGLTVLLVFKGFLEEILVHIDGEEDLSVRTHDLVLVPSINFLSSFLSSPFSPTF